jgi:uncharacterized protein YejL (UPF0352 family)
MKKVVTPILIILIAISFMGCNLKKNSLAEEQQKAIDNSIEFIKNLHSLQKTV